MFYTSLLLTIVLPFLAWLFCFYWSYLFSRDLPPGPFPLPVIGNLHLLTNDLHVALGRLAKQYGELMTIYLGTEPVVVVSSPEIARQVLLGQSNAFGGRPIKLTLGAYLISHNGRDMVFSRNMTIQWKTQRKAFHSALKAFGNGLVLLEDQVGGIVQELLERLETYEGTVRNISEDVRLCMTNIISKVTFGSKYEAGSKKYEEMLVSFDTIQRSLAVGHLTDIFPLLRKLPINFVRQVRNAARVRDSIVDDEYRKRHDERRYKNDDNARNLADSLINQHQTRTADGQLATEEEYNLSEEDIRLVLSTTFGAGLETTATVLYAISCLARQPNLQRQIHDEMRRRLEPDQLPRFTDMRRLPLLHATVSEVYRHSSIVPLLLPHRAIKSALLGNHRIPQDTTVLINAWAIHKDYRFWADPDTFEPTRFLDEDGDYYTPAQTAFIPFGAGKRGCPGKVLGKMAVFVTLARMLYTFRFTMVSDHNVEFEPALRLTLNPNSFEVFIEKKQQISSDF